MPPEPQPPEPDLPREYVYLNIGGEFIGQGRHDYATVAIQTGVEIYVARAFDRLLERLAEPGLREFVAGLFTNQAFTFLGPRQQELWTTLTRDRIQQNAWWEDYKAHTKRRHRVVHAGEHVTAAEAMQSLHTAMVLVQHVHNVLVLVDVRLGGDGLSAWR